MALTSKLTEEPASTFPEFSDKGFDKHGSMQTRLNSFDMTKPAKKVTRIQSENKVRILHAALDVFSRFGYRGSTVDQIADKAGMSKANLLYYFRRKNDIYVAVMASILDQWLTPLAELDPAGDPEEELWTYVKIKLDLSRKNPEASRLFATEILQGAPMMRPFLETELKGMVDAKCRIISQWIADGKLVDIEPIHFVYLIWAATQHYADFATQIEILSGPNKEQTFSDAERTLKTIIFRGVLA